MAVSGPVQLQLDLAQSAFGAAHVMKALINATQIDNVHPNAVFALEALGSFLTVDNRLIGKAMTVLDKGNDYRMEYLKLQLGLSAKGVSSQIRKSTPAIKAFLLISALRHALRTEFIGDVLFEILSQTKALDQHPASPEQLRAAVESLEPHCNKLKEEEAITENITLPILNYIASKDVPEFSQLFYTINPSVEAKCLIAVFEAIRNESIVQIELIGLYGGLHLATVFWLLCQDQVQILFDDGFTVLASSQPNPKISIVLEIFHTHTTTHLWTMKTWHSVQDLAQIITYQNADDVVYSDPDYFSSIFVPRGQVYHHLLSRYDFNSKTLAVSGIFALALTKAACSRGRITRESSHTLPFEAICSDDMRLDPNRSLTNLGWPIDDMDISLVERLASRLSEADRDLEAVMKEEKAGQFLADTDNQATGGKLVESIGGKSDRLDTVAIYAIHLAESILLHATQHGATEFPLKKVFMIGRPDLRVMFTLLGGKRSNSIAASDYLRLAMASVHGYDSDSLVHPTLAISGRGYVAHLSALFKVPQTIPEAFAIVVQAGLLKWRDTLRRRLCDVMEPPHFSTVSNPATYYVVDSKQGLPPLRIGPGSLNFSVQTTTDANTLLLRCHQPNITDNLAKLTWATINWAFAHRPANSGRSKQEHLSKSRDQINETLEFRHPSYNGLHVNEGFPKRTMGVAGYFDDDRANFMRYGSFDANCLDCIDQGSASLLDCIVFARTTLGSRWIIMSNA